METIWTIPASITSENLQSYIDMMKEFITNPLAPNGIPAKDMLKKKSKKKRARKDLDNEDSSQRKRAKKATSSQAYHTQQFILDSDEDDDEDFFAAELKLRQQNVSNRAINHVLVCTYGLQIHVYVCHYRWPHTFHNNTKV
jgi:hypothetical protein